jgi:hypothetical protein
VKATLAPGTYSWLHPTAEWQTAGVRLGSPSEFRVDPDFYVEAREVGGEF